MQPKSNVLMQNFLTQKHPSLSVVFKILLLVLYKTTAYDAEMLLLSLHALSVPLILNSVLIISIAPAKLACPLIFAEIKCSLTYCFE